MALYLGGVDEPDLVGRVIAGGLRVTERAGSTPQGPLYDAEYLDGRPVQLLILPRPAPGEEPAGLRSFRLATRVRHPNVAAVFAVGELGDGSSYVVLEVLDGEPLADLLSAGSALPFGDALDLALQVTAGLEAVHQAGFVHGNVSPGAILVTRPPYGTPQVKLVGFSPDTDRQRAPRVTAESAGYASPERLAGGPPDERSEVFSVGAVFHQLLTGSPASQRQVVTNVPGLARPVLEKALARSPASRYQTMSDLREALEALGVAARAPSRGRGVRRTIGRVIAVGLVLVAGGLLLGPVWRSVETMGGQALRPSSDSQAAVAPQPSPPTAASAESTGVAAPRRSRPPPEGDARRREPSRQRRTAEPTPAPEALGYVGQPSSADPAPDTLRNTTPRNPAPPSAKPAPPAGPAKPPPAPPRPRHVLDEDQGLRLAISDVTRTGLADDVREVRPGHLVVQLAPDGMNVPSASYNLQRLYLAYSAATQVPDLVVLELRRGGEPYGWFTREGLRTTGSPGGR
jgi:serine/threonine protein kinase